MPALRQFHNVPGPFMKTADPGRQFILSTISITIGGFLLRALLLPSQPVSFDDFEVAVSAVNYMESGQLGPTMWNHPVLRNILVYFAMKLFGTGVLGVKGTSLLLGTLCIPLVALVARRIFDDGKTALLAASLWALDPLAIDFSRQAINDIYLAFFPLAGIYLVYRFRDKGNSAWLLGSGVLFGFGLASKWSAVFPLAVTLGLLIAAIRKETKGRKGERYARAAHVSAMLVVLPLLVYILTFIPWFGRGYSLSEWPALQRSMFMETSQHTGYKPDAMVDRDIRAYEWFIRPVTFRDMFFNMDNDEQGRLSAENNVTILLAVSNPLVWLLVLPAALYLAHRGVRERKEGHCFLAALFLLSYIPLVVARRPIWLNTALSVLPFALMAVAYFVWTVASRFRRRHAVVTAYLVLVLAVSLPLYLLVIGKGTKLPVIREYLRDRYLHQKGTPSVDGLVRPQK
jgi:4-amino-4-deoxy-L-arabinose transferase-like glycosyltransferase